MASLNTTVGLLGRERGLPLRAVYGKARRAHRWFAVPPGSPVTALADLAGRRVACDFAALVPLAKSALAEEGVDPESLTWLPWRGSGMESRHMVGPLRSGEVEGVFLIDWNHGDFVAEGLPLRRLPSRALDRITLSSCLFTTERFARERGDVVASIGRAIAKSTVFALENPAAVVDLMWQRHPEARPATADAARVRQRDLAILQARLDSLRPDPDATDPRWGVIERAEITAWQDFLLGSRAITRRLDPAVYYDATHVDVYNDFDAERVRAQARAHEIPR